MGEGCSIGEERQYEMSGLRTLFSKYAKEDKTEAISRASRATRLSLRGNKTTKISRLTVVYNIVS